MNIFPRAITRSNERAGKAKARYPMLTRSRAGSPRGFLEPRLRLGCGGSLYQALNELV